MGTVPEGLQADRLVVSLPRPAAGDFSPGAADYVSRAPLVTDAIRQLAAQRDAVSSVLGALSEEQAGYRYAPGKWTVKELAGHLGDVERVLSYRLLRIGRGDVTPLPGFEEDDYVRGAQTSRRRLSDVVAEWTLVRQATEALVAGMPAIAWTQRGTANNHPVTAAALLYIIVGHVEHHRHILKERYGL